MSTFFDKVQAGSHLLAAAVSLTLGVALVGSGSWCIHRVLGAQSLIYFLSGYSAGRMNLSFQKNLSDVDLLLDELMAVLKIACSTAIIGGILQVVTSALTFQGKDSQKILIIWVVSSVLSSMLSLTSLVLPLAYGLRNFLELHVLFTVSGLNCFIQIHLFVVVVVQIISMRKNMTNGDDAEDSSSTTTAPGVQSPASSSASTSSSVSTRLPTPPPTPPMSPASSAAGVPKAST